jgi:hypothetical protein
VPSAGDHIGRRREVSGGADEEDVDGRVVDDEGNDDGGSQR